MSSHAPYVSVSVDKKLESSGEKNMSEDVNALRVQIVAVDERGKSNTHRINELGTKVDEIDKKQDAIHDLASSIKVLVIDMQRTKEDMSEIKKSQKEIKQEIESVKHEPSKRKARFLDNIFEKIAILILAAILAFMLAKIGL